MMDIEQLQAARTQLIYEFGEIEYERRLYSERAQYLKGKYNQKLTELQEVEAKIDKLTGQYTEDIERFEKPVNEEKNI